MEDKQKSSPLWGWSTPEETGVVKSDPPLSTLLNRLVEKFPAIVEQEKPKKEVPTIHVDEMASKLAVLYEKLREIIDWKEEHLIRRGAIERTLKRMMISEVSGFTLFANLNYEDIAETMVAELIRGGHFANDKIPREKIAKVKMVLEKNIFLFKKSPVYSSPNIKEKINLYEWISEMTACEIEEILDPPLLKYAIIDLMVEALTERIRLAPEVKLSPEERLTQIFIACHRTLYQMDDAFICYRLLKRNLSSWENPANEELLIMASQITAIRQSTEALLVHPLASEFYKIGEKYDTIYLIIGDIFGQFKENPQEIIQNLVNEESLEELIANEYYKRLSTLRRRLFRAAIYATASIFVSGAAMLYLIEVPLAKLVYGQFSRLAVTVDILLPTTVMFLLVGIVRLPKEENLTRVIAEIKKILYPSRETDSYEVRSRKKRGWLTELFIVLLYLITTLGTLAVTYYAFYLAEIPVTSLIIDTVNVAMIVFAGIIIRTRAKEMTIEEKPVFWEFLLDFLSVPIGKVGQWFSKKWKEYNLISIFFTALVDMPVLTFIELIENWSFYLKEKKAEIH